MEIMILINVFDCGKYCHDAIGNQCDHLDVNNYCGYFRQIESLNTNEYGMCIKHQECQEAYKFHDDLKKQAENDIEHEGVE